MTFSELNQKIGPLIEADWHQHSNGSGWVHKNAKVSDETYIGEDAVVWGGTIKGGTIMDGTIWDGTIWGGTIYGGTIKGGIIYGGTIKGGAIRGGIIRGGTIEGGTIKGGTVYGGTIKGGTVKGGIIEGGEWKIAPLFVTDPRGHGCTNSKPGYLRIGCEIHTFQEWQDKFPAIARKHGLTEVEFSFYKDVVDFFCKAGI